MRILEAEGITKKYPGVLALHEIFFEVEEGEVHALVGENGAGKSTLVKMLTGVGQPDSGTIKINGKTLSGIPSAQAAFNLGIGVIHQELSLMPHLDVATNIFAGRLPSLSKSWKSPIVDWKKTYEDADKLLKRVSADFSSKEIVKNLSISQQQLVEIAKAISRNSKIIFMDEPTSSLTPAEVDKLFELIAELKKDNISVVYISHKLEEIMRASDRVTILRDGKKMLTAKISDISLDEIISIMVGGTLNDRYPKVSTVIGDTLLEVKGLNRKGVLHDISFQARRGEILGITGLLGAGRTELVRAIFGADPIDSGEIYVDGKLTKIRNVSDAVNAGIALLTEDRKTQGLSLGLTVNDNIMIPSINCKKVEKNFIRLGFLRNNKIVENSLKYCNRIRVKTPSLQQQVKNLSGGNQQKVIICKWLSTKTKIVIFDEPTRGIDVGSKAEIYKIMEELAIEGATIIMISSELPEVIGISDRILVMRRGCIVAQLDPNKTNEEEIVKYSATEVQNEYTS